MKARSPNKRAEALASFETQEDHRSFLYVESWKVQKTCFHELPKEITICATASETNELFFFLLFFPPA
jgi:hypothetical protein